MSVYACMCFVEGIDSMLDEAPTAVADAPTTPTTTAAAAPAAAASAAPDVVTGVPVRDDAHVLLTTAQLRRQRRELHRELAISSCLKTADAVCHSLPPMSILLCFAYSASALGAIGATLVQQARVPPGSPPYIACVPMSAIALATNALLTCAAVIVGDPELCLLVCGGPRHDAQRNRLLLLLYILVVEAVVLLPLVAPMSIATMPSVGGHCEIDTTLIALVREPTPARALIALCTVFFFAQRVVTIGVVLVIFASLVGGAVLEEPVRVVGAAAAAAMGVALTLGWTLCWRRVANATIWLVATSDRALVNVAHGFVHGNGARPFGNGTMIGPTVAYLNAPDTVGHLAPEVNVLILTLTVLMMANMFAHAAGVV